MKAERDNFSEQICEILLNFFCLGIWQGRPNYGCSIQMHWTVDIISPFTSWYHQFDVWGKCWWQKIVIRFLSIRAGRCWQTCALFVFSFVVFFFIFFVTNNRDLASKMYQLVLANLCTFLFYFYFVAVSPFFIFFLRQIIVIWPLKCISCWWQTCVLSFTSVSNFPAFSRHPAPKLLLDKIFPSSVSFILFCR